MGATTFYEKSWGKTAEEAFTKAVEEAQYQYGHGGYTGTIAEKDSFVIIELPQCKSPYDLADDLMDDDDERVSDKWGDAGCIEVPEVIYTEKEKEYSSKHAGEKLYYFFGVASE